ncbi:MAG: PqqD family protein [Bacteroidales bacterium]|nr:PqqD family protein [Bacteroidales bacterium]
MKLNSNLILRQIGREYMIVNPFSDTIDMAQVYSMNDTAAWLWEHLEDKEFTADEMASLLCDEYEVDMETARKDANELCRQWLESGLAME